MENRWQVAISAAILAAVWSGVADIFHLVTWVGFLGCTTYFAQPKTGLQGVVLSWFTNLSGVFWAWLIISAGSYFTAPALGYLFTGIATAGMCLQASSRHLSFIPGTFVGCCAMFAMNGDLAAVVPTLMMGVLLGYGMVQFSNVLVSLTHRFVSKPTSSTLVDS